MNQWVEGTLFDNIDKFANSLGYENASVILPLSMVPWQSVEDRNAFITMLTNKSPAANPEKNLSEVNQKAKVK